MLSKLCKLSLIIMLHTPLLQTLLHILSVDEGQVFLFLRKFSHGFIETYLIHKHAYELKYCSSRYQQDLK